MRYENLGDGGLGFFNAGRSERNEAGPYGKLEFMNKYSYMKAAGVSKGVSDPLYKRVLPPVLIRADMPEIGSML